MEKHYNTRSPAVKRLMKEARELSEPTDQYYAQPLEDNLFEWHFTIRGPADSDFQNGVYHGRIVLPIDYPMKPPSIIWLTPNGRFETNKKICLSISGHHPESWQPSWSIRTALLAIIGFMPTHSGGAIGALDYTPEERKTLARRSRGWKCHNCGDVTGILLERVSGSESTSKEAKELAAQINFQGEKPKSKDKTDAPAVSSSAPSSPSPASESKDSLKKNIEDTNLQQPQPAQPVGITWPNPACPMPFLPPQNLPWMDVNQFMMGGRVPHFPFPPSCYPYPQGCANFFYPPGYAMPPGGYPYPFPPSMHPPNSNAAAMSTNNSSSGGSESNDSPAAESVATPQVSYTRTPMTCPVLTKPSEVDPSSANMEPQDAIEIPGKDMMLQELLDKTTRVGSLQNVDMLGEKLAVTSGASFSVNADEIASIVTTAKKDDENSASLSAVATGDVLLLAKGLSSEIAIGSEEKELDVQSHGVAGAGSSLRRRKQSSSKISVDVKTEASGNQTASKQANETASPGEESELGEAATNLKKTCDGQELESAVDAEDSESGVPPIEVSDSEQRGHIEASLSNSEPELENRKQEGDLGHKDLRQRQSATANVPAESNEDVFLSSETAAPHVDGQRIEAASGDVPARNVSWQSRPPTPRLGIWGVIDGLRERQHDVSFIVMFCLTIVTAIIFLNRIIRLMGLV